MKNAKHYTRTFIAAAQYRLSQQGQEELGTRDGEKVAANFTRLVAGVNMRDPVATLKVFGLAIEDGEPVFIGDAE